MNNYVTIVGSISRNPKITEFENGNKVARFAITTPKVYRKNDGKYTSKLDWHRVFAWGNMASFVHENAELGKKVAIHGRVVQRTYLDKEGKKQSLTELELRQIIGL
ncbi:MAG: single-stranded DNA-binding protein [Flavobacteriia bacterium]|jgi:single-strand DNA-binding protein|nr:single-stranded DNA-binding protein [Flavobacteriia bacterium]NBV67814.1 single-stranded DNA-binding protein [Flavobacteriia bacterium]NBV91811.1 single-stranded DNA-binding protein [Flavobacteriia bacterium]NBY41216.1 single-stranded DNA-binding protein [Flavobacteriia bacterium]